MYSKGQAQEIHTTVLIQLHSGTTHAYTLEDHSSADLYPSSSGGRTEIRSGGLAREAAKQPIICAKHPCAKVRN